jgi:hypothetical protein
MAVQHVKGAMLQLGQPKRWLPLVSLGGVLLRLMMAGAVHVFVGPTSFLVAFALTEVIALFSRIITKELMPMAPKVLKFVKERTIKAGNRHLPLSGVTPLMSPWKSGERASR